ncbi:hypothetical protein MJG53_006717 [Ovis ammon polii x Ovis aries]|uniref:Uncharacterized protein n=1 Tax=Ovis ammon polii x Ovis aries TaxID=2918886 RepID=A0ACB9V5T0_9CETA|nr:hypothetical protein MJG53_006717 [Ovis ammon polii x Ovis aries]
MPGVLAAAVRSSDVLLKIRNTPPVLLGGRVEVSFQLKNHQHSLAQVGSWRQLFALLVLGATTLGARRTQHKLNQIKYGTGPSDTNLFSLASFMVSFLEELPTRMSLLSAAEMYNRDVNGDFPDCSLVKTPPSNAGDCVSCLEYKALLMPQMLKNHEEIERYSRISSTKSIQRKNLVKQDRLLGRPGCPSIPSRSTIQENAIDMRVIQNLQPLNKQYERIAERKQRVMHVEQKRLE